MVKEIGHNTNEKAIDLTIWKKFLLCRKQAKGQRISWGKKSVTSTASVNIFYVTKLKESDVAREKWVKNMFNLQRLYKESNGNM